MKKTAAIFLCVLLMILPFAALAEETVKIDLTEILTTIITLVASAIAALATYAWKKYVRPWLEAHELIKVAEIVVSAAEVALGRYKGEEKWKMALEKIKEYGYDIESEIVLDAVAAAWQKLNLNQLTAGVKQPEGGGTDDTPKE